MRIIPYKLRCFQTEIYSIINYLLTLNWLYITPKYLQSHMTRHHESDYTLLFAFLIKTKTICFALLLFLVRFSKKTKTHKKNRYSLIVPNATQKNCQIRAVYVIKTFLLSTSRFFLCVWYNSHFHVSLKKFNVR